MNRLSVIIPFKNGEEYISRFFDGIALQNLSFEDYELIFISNNTTDRSLEKVKEYCKNIKNSAVFIYNEKSGSYAARNYGIGKAKYEIIVFIDIDCKMSSDFLINLFNIFNDTNADAVAGKITLELENSNNVWEIYDAVSNLNNERMLQNNRIATANFSVRKNIIDSVGLFSEFISSGDSEFGERLVSKKIRIVYKSDIEVFHPTRKTYESIKDKLNRIAYGEGQRASKEQKNRYKYMIIYFAKAINFININRLWRKMRKYVKLRCFLVFALKFTGIRMKQIISFQKGYLNADLLKYNL